jgi:hypothetical protein
VKRALWLLALLTASSVRADDAGLSGDVRRDAGATAPMHAGRAPPSPRTREPSVAEVVRMARRAARSLDSVRIRELARRARLAGLAPQLRLSAERGFDQDLTSSTSRTTDSTRAAIGDQLRFGATLTFDLDRLVFAAEEVRLLSVERWLATDMRKLLGEVVRLYFQRRRLLRELASARAPDEELVDSIRETEALLDALTGGEFAKALATKH